MPISLVLNVIIAVLLLLTIAYAARLNHRLSQLRADKNELQKLAKTFADATVRAEASIKQLKISSDALTSEVARAESLKDDLAYLVERGGRTADQMVESVRTPAKPPQDEESRLIEEAIRAATPTAGGGMGDDDERPSTRRISGRSPARPQAGPQTGPQAGLMSAQERAEDHHMDEMRRHRGEEEADTIGDSDAARELLKALNSVK